MRVWDTPSRLSLANLYRPHDWDSVVGQEYTKTILRNALSSGRVGSAYLFHGMRGTGKTTSARILAQWVNCIDLREGNPCHVCVNCQSFENGNFLDIIEIDAASNTGVDHIRELIETAMFQPNQGKYKVYIIDEVHMLSKGAFNALLKILEEPPTHVKFILATTEIEKVPDTIRSRSQRFDFRKIAESDIADQLEKICRKEWIHAERNALMLIARLAKGALRDAITLLEQNRVDDTITKEHIMNTLSMVDEIVLVNMVQSILKWDRESLKSLLSKMYRSHINIRIFIEEMLFYLRDELYEIHDKELWNEKMRIFDGFIAMYEKIKYVPDTFLLLEMTTLKLTASIEHSNDSTTQKWKDRNIEEEKENRRVRNPLQKEQEKENSSSEDRPFSFNHLVSNIREKKASLANDLKNVTFEQQEKVLILYPRSKWTYDRIDTHEHKGIILMSLRELFGGLWNLELKLHEENPVSPLKSAVDEVF